MIDKWEIDIEKQRYTRKAQNGGMDGDHFFLPVECTYIASIAKEVCQLIDVSHEYLSYQ